MCIRDSFVFVHIGVPLLLLFGLWFHIQRVTRAAVMPPRALALGLLATLAVLALAWPVTSHAPAALARWKEQQGLAFDLLSDPDHAVLAKWGAWGEKSMYGKKYEGVIRSHWIVGEDGRILDEQIKVSPSDSVALAEKFLSDG